MNSNSQTIPVCEVIETYDYSQFPKLEEKNMPLEYLFPFINYPTDAIFTRGTYKWNYGGMSIMITSLETTLTLVLSDYKICSGYDILLKKIVRETNKEIFIYSDTPLHVNLWGNGKSIIGRSGNGVLWKYKFHESK